MNASMYKLVEPFGREFRNAVISNPPDSYTQDYTLESYFGVQPTQFKTNILLMLLPVEMVLLVSSTRSGETLDQLDLAGA